MAIRFDIACHMLLLRVTRALAIVVPLCCSACDATSLSAPPAAASCTSIGSQCQLPDGPLGVCQEVPCDPGATRPCFKCTSQH